MADSPTTAAPGTSNNSTTDVAKEGFQQGTAEANNPQGDPAKPDTAISANSPAAANQPRMFTEAEVQKFRADEKAKLYGELQARETELARFKAEEAEREKTKVEAAAKADAEAKAAREAEMSAKQLLEQRDAEWNTKFDTMNKQWESEFAKNNAEREQERALAAKEREYNEFLGFRAQRLQEETGNIAPELIDLVTGNNREELEASIATMRAKSEQIAQTVQTYAQQARANQRGVSAASFPTAGPDVDNPGGQQLTPDDIRNMNMEQYAEFRKRAGIGGSQSGRGLFG